MNTWDIPRYAPTFAGRLINLSPGRVRRWLRGYEYKYVYPAGTDVSRRVRKEPVIKRMDHRESIYASFLDLVDLLFVKRFLDYGLSLQMIRKALTEVESIIGAHHFAQKSFFTDGREIYLQVRDREPESLIQLLSGGQWVIVDVIKRVAAQIEFHKETGFAERWYPWGKEGKIVLDPQICFGAPTIVQKAVRTANVYDLFIAENYKPKSVASWLDLNPSDVKVAVEFEKSLAAAA